MVYRWTNVVVERGEDGTTEVRFEGRSEFPFGESVDVEPGETVRVSTDMELDSQPENVSWRIKKDGTTVAEE